MSFHFIRPEWLLALIPLVILLWKLIYRQTKQGSWDNIIDPAFREVLLPDRGVKKPFPWGITGLLFIWLLSIIALSGPTWQEVKVPAEKSLQGNVIVLDLSLSMLADDLRPDRITRAKHKIIDLLETYPQYAMGMVVYAGTAHAITPISQDNQTLLSLARTLTPTMMPLFGSNPIVAMQLAQQLLEGAKVKKGHIIWITDDLGRHQKPALKDFFNNIPHSLSILTVGTKNGAPINLPRQGLLQDAQGQIVIAQLPYERLVNFARSVNASIAPLGLSNKDIQTLLPPSLATAVSEDEAADKKLSQWLDKGTYLLFAIILLAALAFRRGWLLSFSLVLLLPTTLLYSPPTFAEKSELRFADFFLTLDKQGYLFWQENDYTRAEIRFEDPAWRGVTFYRLGRFEEAAEQFSLDKTARGYYNLGNSLAQLGRLEEAKQAYQAALRKMPNHAKAQANLQLINSLLNQKEQEKAEKGTGQKSPAEQEQKDPQQKSAEMLSDDQTRDQSNNQSKDPLPDNSQNKEDNQEESQKGNADKTSQESEQNKPGQAEESDQKSEQKLTSDADDKHQGEDGSDQKAGKLGGQQDQADADQAMGDLAADKLTAEEKQSQAEQRQAKQAWLRRIPDEPGLFLQRKFKHQYKTQSSQQSSTDKIW